MRRGFSTRRGALIAAATFTLGLVASGCSSLATPSETVVDPAKMPKTQTGPASKGAPGGKGEDSGKL